MTAVALLFAAAFLALTSQSDDQVATALKRAPTDVRALIERRMSCNHWAGEEPYDRDRAKQIDDAGRALRCRQLDKDDAVLRRRYAARPNIVRLLRTSIDWME